MNNDKDILLIAIFTFITVSIWIFFELTNTSKTDAVTPKFTEILKPLDPKLDQNTVNILNDRILYE